MKDIIVFTENEKALIDALKESLSKGNKKNEIVTIINNENALVELSTSISKYPSILKTQHLGGASRSIETLWTI